MNIEIDEDQIVNEMVSNHRNDVALLTRLVDEATDNYEDMAEVVVNLIGIINKNGDRTFKEVE